MVKEKLAVRMARVQLSRQIKKEKKERREVILQVVSTLSRVFGKPFCRREEIQGRWTERRTWSSWRVRLRRPMLRRRRPEAGRRREEGEDNRR